MLKMRWLLVMFLMASFVAAQITAISHSGDCTHYKFGCKLWIKGSNKCAQGKMTAAKTYRKKCAADEEPLDAIPNEHDPTDQCGQMMKWVWVTWVYSGKKCGGRLYGAC